MTNFKKGIWTIIGLDFVVAYVITAIHSESFIDPFVERAFWFLPVLIIIPSFLFAMFVIVLFYKDGRESKIQFYCQFSGLLMTVCFFTYTPR